MNAPNITELISRWQQGDKTAEANLFDALYPVLKKQALGALFKCTPGKLSLSGPYMSTPSVSRNNCHRNKPSKGGIGVGV